MKKIILVSFILTFLLSCNQKSFDSSEEFFNYLNDPDNDYFQEKIINGVTISLLYQPTDLLIFQEVNNDSLQIDNLEALKINYSNYLYFTLSFSINNKELLSTLPKNTDQFGALATILSFNMDKSIYLTNSNKDTFDIIDIVYPRMYGLSKKTTLLLIFENNPNQLTNNDLTLYIKDFGINTGDIKFKIPIHLIDNQPTLNFNH